MSKTPETDDLFGHNSPSSFACLCRDLETQRDEAIKRIQLAGGYHARTAREIEIQEALDETGDGEKDSSDQAIADLLEIVEAGRNRVYTAETQRDEARAEVERLRKAITDVLPGMKCQQPPKLGAWNWPWAVETLETALQPDLTGWRPADAPEKLTR